MSPRCPACSGTLHERTVGGHTLDTCDTCAGIWFDRGELEGHLAGPPTADAPGSTLARGAVYRRCPRCDQPMTPRTFERRSGVVLDLCAKHGAWVDAGELTRLRTWLTSQRRARVDPKEEAHELRRSASLGTDTSARADTFADGFLLGDVASLVWDAVATMLD